MACPELVPGAAVPVMARVKPVVVQLSSAKSEADAQAAWSKLAKRMPELVERQWYQYFLHNQRARILAASLLTQGTHRIVIVNVPWYLHKRR